MRYIIQHPNNHTETTDLLGVLRKIRTNRLQKLDMLATDNDNAAKPAYQYAELYEVFIEQDQEAQQEVSDTHHPSLWAHVKSSIAVLKDDITSAALTGMLVMVILLLLAAGVVVLPKVLAVLLVPLISYFLFNLCLIAHLRLARVQLLPMHYILGIVKKHGTDLCFATIPPALISVIIPWMSSQYIGIAGWGIALVIGLPAITYFLYVPLLIIDRELKISDALKLNHHVISNMGMDVFAQMMGVLFINVLAGPFILLTLPVTLLALMQLYDTRFVEY
jgi:hypothetical protein